MTSLRRKRIKWEKWKKKYPDKYWRRVALRIQGGFRRTFPSPYLENYLINLIKPPSQFFGVKPSIVVFDEFSIDD